MKHGILISIILLSGLGACASSGPPTPQSNQVAAVAPGADSEQPDEIMWQLLREPYRSDDNKFIDHVRVHGLLHHRDRDGDTVLSIAALNGQTSVIDYLAANGVDIDAVNNKGNTVFSYAIKFGDPVRNALLRHGANIDHTGSDGRTPLINAVLSADAAAVEYLAGHGADLDHIDSSGGSALYYAVSANDLEMVRGLVEAGANVNVETRSRPLQRAMAYNHPRIISYLASRGAEL